MGRSWGIKSIPTTFDNYPSKRSKRERIRIPQADYRPLGLHQRDLLNRDLLGGSQWWATVHKRGLAKAPVGTDHLEARAIPLDKLRGTLPERIVYKYLVERLYLQEGIDFTFQSSMLGGRMALGGIVADFVFPILRIVIQVQGVTHRDFLRMRKDTEQVEILEDFGYEVFGIDDTTIYNQPQFEQTMKRIFDLWGSESETG